MRIVAELRPSLSAEVLLQVGDGQTVYYLPAVQAVQAV
jgi:hypothetical protein